MERPVLSPQFTIDDIHKLREYNSYITSNMSPKEEMDYYNNAAKAFQEEIERRRCGRETSEIVEFVSVWP